MSDQHWRDWNLKGMQVNFIRFSHQVDIHVASMDARQRDFLLCIEASFTLRQSGGAESLVVPGQPQTLHPLLMLLHSPVAVFRAASDGTCQVQFEDGAVLSCAPDENYEAWNSHGTGDLADASLLCGPGGGSPWG